MTVGMTPSARMGSAEPAAARDEDLVMRVAAGDELAFRCREDQDGGRGRLEPERLERLEGTGVVEGDDHRVLIRYRTERREVRDPRDVEPLPFELGPEIVAGAHQQHADLVASHAHSSRDGHPIPRGVATRSR